MVNLKGKMEIIQMHLMGESNRSIAAKLGLNRKTVDKYVAQYKTAQAEILAHGSSRDAVREAAESIVAAPAYKKRNSPPRKWNAEMDEFLDAILAAEEEKRKKLRTGKQQLTKAQIHALMRGEGFDIGLTTVSRKIDARRHAAPEAFVAQSYRYGQRFEYDFGEARLYIAGKFTKVFMAVMTAPASGYRFAFLYPHQRFDAFADSQVRFFERMGGCFEEGVYDNMRNVVAKFVGRGEKLLNGNLMALAAYYGFRVVTTNAREGNEKGSVENAVKAVRNAAFVAA
ncbi:helix-turn-helix domain-containing protein [Collinsella tanakaei]|uniref:helix-turn-helix domain-containing protein n=1 Tax=Collinsella tanakaei TaxID=626935 RepID=UPI001F2C78B0|nr:helix-turn-helix domain-containing protein [Collinsella tanakaei]MCF2622049.1 transposase [Collinsella tanakaei]